MRAVVAPATKLGLSVACVVTTSGCLGRRKASRILLILPWSGFLELIWDRFCSSEPEFVGRPAVCVLGPSGSKRQRKPRMLDATLAMWYMVVLAQRKFGVIRQEISWSGRLMVGTRRG